ncbi:unnamed protein product [Effrenium voratum]|uniref:site-specific DNA-methyltransferase (adenine-specific) n=1 Tax=Effrenium voratum TaxID=2562239 RepID=A0AA36N425_9DINO|nr:unnamed protein product [Effrenium voratum]
MPKPETISFIHVDPVSPPAPYLGGKRMLSRRIIEIINATPHDGYGEAFVGMGGVFFRRNRQPKTEVVNDISGEVANLFRILQRHYPQFMEVMKFQLTSRREFERLSATDPATLTDLERAARFLYLQRTAFGAKVASRNFAFDRRGGARFNLTRLAPLLEDVHERLAGVLIECLDWQRFLDKHDREGMLTYLDPPYFGNEEDYGKGLFGREDFATMAQRLAKLKGSFILSINDKPEIREMFSGFTIEAVDCTYTVNGKKPGKFGELIISGRNL